MKIKIINCKVKILVTDGIPDKSSEIYEKWEMLGHYKDLSEEQWKGIVEDVEPASLGLFPDYNFKPTRLKAIDWHTTTQSGLSLIESEVCLKNPLGPEKQYYYGEQGMTNEEFDEKVSRYRAAEDQVYHNPVIFWEKK